MPSTTPKPKTSSRRKASKLNALLKHDVRILAEQPVGCQMVGLDEVGRGSLISSVVAGAVCLPPKLTREQRNLLKWLDDSKKLLPGLRAELATAIQSFCKVGIGIAEKEEVDAINVHYASLLALYRAFEQLCRACESDPEHPDWYLIMDGRAVIPDLRRESQLAIIKGDGCSAAIAAASVVAKEYRDSQIKELAVLYPGYGWERNMGYGVPEHLEAIRRLGRTPLHRKNFKLAYQQLQFELE